MIFDEFDEGDPNSEELRGAIEVVDDTPLDFGSNDGKLYPFSEDQPTLRNNLGTLYLYMGELDRPRDYLEIARTQFRSELAVRNFEMLELSALSRGRGR